MSQRYITLAETQLIELPNLSHLEHIQLLDLNKN